MATTTRHEVGMWDTFHNNGPFPTRVLFKTSLEGKGKMPSIIDRYNDAAAEVQRLIKEALDKKEGFRAYGSAWSLSHIAHHKDNMHYNASMNLKKNIQPGELHAGSGFKAENLFLLQCGNVVKEIHNFLFDHGKSLKTCGASNGQTIGGCISTGVHGSALDEGSVQDCVVGINLIIGPGADDIVYLERETQPALSDSFIGTLKSRVIRDDELFNAAVVGLGAFGFIHGVVIEAADRFLLNRYVRRMDKDLAMGLAETVDFEHSAFKIPGETDANGNGLTPYHYKIFMNPYVNDREYVVEVMYKKPYRTDYPDPIPRIKTAVYRDLLDLFTHIAGRFKNSIPKLIKLLQGAILPPVDLETTGTLGETFWDAQHQGPAFACSVGVAHTDCRRALDVLANLVRTEGPIPGIFAMRFVKQSKATLAFTRFPVTCMLEIDGLIWKGRPNKMISLEQFCARMIDVLNDNHLPFTLHWGKNADWSHPDLVKGMYGSDKADTWKKHRNALLSKEAAALFSNDFLKQVQLA